MDNPMNLIHVIITCVISFVVTLVIAWLIIKPEDVLENPVNLPYVLHNSSYGAIYMLSH